MLPEGCLVLVEAMAHRDAHLDAGIARFLRDTAGAFHRVGDRLLGEDVQAVFEGEVYHLLVEGRRHDDGAEIGLAFFHRLASVGVELLIGQAKSVLCIDEVVGIDINRGDNLDKALLDARGQESHAPGAAEAAGADVDATICH